MFDSRKNEDDAGSKSITGEKQMTFASFLNRQFYSYQRARWNKSKFINCNIEIFMLV